MSQGEFQNIEYLTDTMFRDHSYEMVNQVRCESKETPSDLNDDERLRLLGLYLHPTAKCYLSNSIYKLTSPSTPGRAAPVDQVLTKYWSISKLTTLVNI